LALGSGTWNITASDGGFSPYAWDINQSFGLTITGSATINMSCSSGTQIFRGGGATYPTLNCGATGPGSHGVYIYGSNTFTNISASGSVATSLYFDTFTTQTVSNFTYSGSSGITRYLNAVSPPASLSKSGGSISVQYLSISGVSGTGGCIWFAYPINGNSVSGGAIGWVTTGGGTFIDMLT
jgi:hypothetical protein